MKLLKIISVAALCCALLPTHCAQKNTNPFAQQKVIPNSLMRRLIALPCECPEIDRIRPELNEETALTHAVYTNHTRTVCNLLKDGADINAPNAKEQTPLHVAVFIRRFKMVKRLLRSGAATSLGITDNEGHTPLAVALLWNAFIEGIPTRTTNANIIRLLLEHGADRTAHVSPKTIYYAISASNMPFLERILICPGVESTINAKHDWGTTPLRQAVCEQNPKAVSLLLQAGADPNSTNWDNTTPLYNALRCCFDNNGTPRPKASFGIRILLLPIIEQLLLHGAKIDRETATHAFKVGKAYNHPICYAAVTFDLIQKSDAQLASTNSL